MRSSEATRRFEEAKRLFAEGRPAEALTLLQSVDEAFPGDKNILYPMALCLEALGRPQDAAAIARHLVELHDDPRSRRLVERLAAGTAAASGVNPLTGVPDFRVPDLSDLDNLATRHVVAPPPPESALGTWLPYIAAVAVGLLVIGGMVALAQWGGDGAGETPVARTDTAAPAPAPTPASVEPPPLVAPDPEEEAIEDEDYYAEGERGGGPDFGEVGDVFLRPVDFAEFTTASWLVLGLFFLLNGLPLYFVLFLFDKLPYSEPLKDFGHTWLITFISEIIRGFCCVVGLIVGIVLVHRTYDLEWHQTALWLIASVVMSFVVRSLIFVTLS